MNLNNDRMWYDGVREGLRGALQQFFCACESSGVLAEMQISILVLELEGT